MREGHQIGVALRGGDHRREIGTLIDAQARFPFVLVDDLDRGRSGPIRCAPAVANGHNSLRYLGPQLGEVTGPHDPARVDDDDVLADVLDEVELVAGEQHRRARRGDLGQHLGHRAHRERVESRERLVEDEQLARLVDQRR